MAGVDVRSVGSGNIGATNVARTLGARLGLITLLADAAKGSLPLLILHAAGVSRSALALAGGFAFIGHLFPVFARFRGGKGVATAAGVFLVLCPYALCTALAVFAIVVMTRRIVSLASLSAGSSIPVFVALFEGATPTLWLSLFIAASLVATHRDNLRRLANGTEPRFELRHC
jgi:glycerol-3-phosphate acyltransferase PlsY